MLNRRKIIQIGIIGAASLLLPEQALSSIKKLSHQEKKLFFYNTHTGEKLKTVFWSEGHYVKDSLHSINWILRDHRRDEICPIDTKLLDLLHSLQKKTGCPDTFHIVSGYRSPQTNKMLQKKSDKVAKKSFHMRGMAIDIRVPGFDLKKLHSAAVHLRKGGVGYYPQSGFIHVDVGNVRSW